MLRVQRELEGTVYVVVYIFKMFEVYIYISNTQTSCPLSAALH